MSLLIIAAETGWHESARKSEDLFAPCRSDFSIFQGIGFQLWPAAHATAAFIEDCETRTPLYWQARAPPRASGSV